MCAYWTVEALFVVNKALLARKVCFMAFKHTFPFDLTHAKFYKLEIKAKQRLYALHLCTRKLWLEGRFLLLIRNWVCQLTAEFKSGFPNYKIIQNSKHYKTKFKTLL